MAAHDRTMSDLVFAPPRLLSPAAVRALRGRGADIVLFGAGTRADLRAAAAAVGLPDAPAVVEGGAAILLPRTARARFSCLNGPAWIADGDEAVVQIGRPIEDWKHGLDKLRAWAREAFVIDVRGREYSAAVDVAGEDAARKLDAFAGRQDVRLSFVDGAWLLHARFGRTEAFRQIVEYYRGVGAAARTVAVGLADAAPADRCVGSVDEFLAG